MPLGVVLVLSSASAQAQEKRTFIACQSQQQLQQVLNSDGKFVPDDCRQMSVTTIASEPEPTCVLDLAAGKEAGFIDRLTEAALPTQWWFACSRLGAR